MSSSETGTSSIWITLLVLTNVLMSITGGFTLLFCLLIMKRDLTTRYTNPLASPRRFWGITVALMTITAVIITFLLLVFVTLLTSTLCVLGSAAYCQGEVGFAFASASCICLCCSCVYSAALCQVRNRRLNISGRHGYSSSSSQGPMYNENNVSERMSAQVKRSLINRLVESDPEDFTPTLHRISTTSSHNHDQPEDDSDWDTHWKGSRDCLLPRRSTKGSIASIPISRNETLNPEVGYVALASKNTERCKKSESVQSFSSSSNFLPFSGAEPATISHGGSMPGSPWRPPFSCLTAGGGSSYCNSSLCTYDRDPPDYHDIWQSRLQSSDPYSIREPEHSREYGTFNIWDSQISAAERQEVPVMPEGRPSLPPLSKIAIPEQLCQSCFVLGDVHTISLTHLGGTFPLYPFGQPEGVGKPQIECCATLEAPPGVVERGINLYVHYAIILDGPFKFPENWKRTSVVLYIDCPDNHLMLEPVKLSLHHWAAVGSCRSMSFMKSKHFLEEGQNKFKFEHHALSFLSNTKVANLYLKNQFCLVCTAVDEFEVGMSRYYGMLVIDPLEDGVQKFWLCLTYAVPTWIQAVKEYFRKEENNEKRVLPECQELELGSDDKVSLVVQTMSGAGWALTVTKKEIWLKKVNEIFSKYPSCKTKKRAVLCGQYPPTVHFKITYETDPSPITHVRKPNFATLSSNADSLLHFTVHEKINSSSGVDVNPSMMHPARASLTDSSYSSGYEEDSFQHLKATKEFTLQNLMNYLNDLADVGRQIAGWLGMKQEFSVIGKTPGITTPQEQLQELLTQWLEDSEWPNAPHDWEFFIRVVRGVNKGKLAERIKKEVFKEPDQTASLHSVEDYQNIHHSDIADVPLTDSLFVAWGDHEQTDPNTFKDEVSDISEEYISRLAEEMAPYWLIFGGKLGLSKEELQEIRESNDCGNVDDSDKACCSVMLHRWVRTGNQKEKTHDRLQHKAKEAKAVEEFEPPTYSDIAFST